MFVCLCVCVSACLCVCVSVSLFLLPLTDFLARPEQSSSSSSSSSEENAGLAGQLRSRMKRAAKGAADVQAEQDGERLDIASTSPSPSPYLNPTPHPAPSRCTGPDFMTNLFDEKVRPRAFRQVATLHHLLLAACRPNQCCQF